MKRVKDNITKVNTFDPTKEDFGAQVRQQGYIVFKVEFPVYNHPEMIRDSPCNVRFGIKNSAERFARCRPADLRRYAIGMVASVLESSDIAAV